MHLFRGAQLHPGDKGYTCFFTRLKGRGAVEAGVVVCNRDDIKSAEFCHIDYIVRGHLIIATGRQAGV